MWCFRYATVTIWILFLLWQCNYVIVYIVTIYDCKKNIIFFVVKSNVPFENNLGYLKAEGTPENPMIFDKR